MPTVFGSCGNGLISVILPMKGSRGGVDACNERSWILEGQRKLLKRERDLHLVAHKLTAALSTICLQFSPAPLAPLNARRMLGLAGLIPPAAAAACRARIVGRYRLSAVQERYVRDPERS